MRTLSIVAESIDFQSHKLFDHLTQIFADLMQKRLSRKEAKAHGAAGLIKKLVAEHTGVNVSILFDTQYPPCVLVPTLKKDHQFVHEYLRQFAVDDYEKILKSAEKNKTEAWINLKTAKLGGVFSQIESPIYMSVDYLQSLKLTPEECAAIVLHEVGHIYTFYEYLSRTITANQVLATVHKSLMANGTNDEHKIILKRAGKVINDEHAFDEITDVKDAKVVTTVVLRKALAAPRSDMGTSGYDNSSAEQSADQFATRFGAGRNLVTALDKIHVSFHMMDYSASARVSGYISQVVVFGLQAMMIIVGAVASPFYFVIGLASLFTLIFAAGEQSNDHTYDSVRVRFMRIREQQIQYLKDNKISDADAKDAIDAVNQIQKSIDQLKPYHGMYAIVANFFSVKNRQLVTARELQRDLEELAANDIFLRAKELSFIQA